MIVMAGIPAPDSLAADESTANSGSSSLADLFSSRREYLTGNWGGRRDRLEEWGLTPTINYQATILGNPVGGERKGLKYAAQLNLYLDFDLEKLLNIKDTMLHSSISWSSGQSLSSDDIGNYFFVSSIFSGNSLRLYQFFLESNLWNDLLTVAIGRMAIGDDFATTALFGYYVSDAFDPNIGSIVVNVPGFYAEPVATWGLRVKLRPADEFYVSGGVYNSSPLAGQDSAFGVDFSFRNGFILVGEAGYTPNIQEASGGLAGYYKIGAYYDTGDFNELAGDGNKQSGNYGFYAIADQMVYREPGTEDQGLALWGAAAFAPEEEINTFPVFLSAGIAYGGLIPARDGDKALFGLAYGSVSDELPGQDYEIVLEGTYAIQIAPWLSVQPDVQYIIHPGGGGIPNALVLGALLSLNL